MTAPLREQLQMARINRVKRRTHDWWHRERCEGCRLQRLAQAELGVAVSAMVQRVHDDFMPPVGSPTEPQKH